MRSSSLVREAVGSGSRPPVRDRSPSRRQGRRGGDTAGARSRTRRRWTSVLGRISDVRRRAIPHANARVSPGAAGPHSVFRAGDEFGVRVCWLGPVAGGGGLLLGTVTTYQRSPRGGRSCDRERATERSRISPLERHGPPQVPRQIGSVELASHYRTGDRTVAVGGDWFDAVPVDDGLVLVMGDVEGHDSRAAALMQELRAVTRVAGARRRTRPPSSHVLQTGSTGSTATCSPQLWSSTSTSVPALPQPRQPGTWLRLC